MTSAHSVTVTGVDAQIGERFHTLMWRRKVSQSKFAGAVGLSSQAAASRKLRGQREWTASELLQACRFFGITVAELLDGIEPEECAIRDSNPEPAD